MTEQMTEHTPGPWAVDLDLSKVPLRQDTATVYDSEENSIADLYHGRIEANAHLIAAAPDLLTLLDELDRRVVWESVGLGNEIAERVEAAIAKAKGQTP